MKYFKRRIMSTTRKEGFGGFMRVYRAGVDKGVERRADENHDFFIWSGYPCAMVGLWLVVAHRVPKRMGRAGACGPIKYEV